MKTAAPPPLATEFRRSWIEYVIMAAIVGLGVAGVRYMMVMAVRPGGATALPAPEKQYLAMARARSKEYFWGGRREFFELRVGKREVHENDLNYPWRYLPDRTIIVDRIDGLPFPSERGSEACGIQWLPDASQVTFDFQGVTVSVSTANL